LDIFLSNSVLIRIIINVVRSEKIVNVLVRNQRRTRYGFFSREAHPVYRRTSSVSKNYSPPRDILYLAHSRTDNQAKLSSRIVSLIIIINDSLRLDKIFEFAHLWQPTSEKPNDEDWDDEQDANNETEVLEPIIMTYRLPKPLDSAIGKPLDPGSSTTATIKLGRMKLRDLHSSGASYFGSLTRLLCLGLDELHRKHQLYQTESGAYVMRQEMRQSKSNQMSFVRKVFITPATIHYEGPHPEEHSTVTRQFIDLQDRFIRVSFRDEGKLLKPCNHQLLFEINIVYNRLSQTKECEQIDDYIVQAYSIDIE
jgi:hypothetical protein